MITLHRSVPKGTVIRLSGTAQPYGEIVVTVTATPRSATVRAAGLPAAELGHPGDGREGRVPLDERTVLTVGGVRATITPPGKGLRKRDRELRLELAGRVYTYRAGAANVEELHRHVPLVRSHAPLGSTTTVTVLPEADETDVALALLLLGADTNGLTLTRSAISGVVGFLQTGQGEA